MSTSPLPSASRPHPASLRLKIAAGAVLLLLAIWLGSYFGHHLPALERWIESHGIAGFAVFVAVLVLCTSLFVPDTIFAVAAGVLFGLFWGTALVVVGSLLAAGLDFAISRHLLRTRVRRWLESHPKLAAIERAVTREGLRLQFLLRLTPVHPVAVSYVLGASQTRFSTFLIASMGLIPLLFVEVYFGYTAKHLAKAAGQVSEHSSLHIVITIAGLLLCTALMVYIVRLARGALAGVVSPVLLCAPAAGLWLCTNYPLTII
jgi:uncharacterized membrane protein YdjX (TVP38/TMEM64 family)